MSVSQFWIIMSGSLGFLSVAFGAFGAHALKEKLDPAMLQIFHTGVHYQFFHSIVLLMIGFYFKINEAAGNSLSSSLPLSLHHSAKCFLAGIFIFSGSLYILSLSGVRWLGAITPIGGVLFLAGWIFLIKFGMETK